MTAGRILLDVAVILVAARVGAAALRARRPAGVIGEIVAGIALGPTLLGALPGDPSNALFPADARPCSAIGQLGLALFMFTVGWELDLRLVRQRERAAPRLARLDRRAVRARPRARRVPALRARLRRRSCRSGRSRSSSARRSPSPRSPCSPGSCARRGWPARRGSARRCRRRRRRRRRLEHAGRRAGGRGLGRRRGTTCGSSPRRRCSGRGRAASCGRCCRLLAERVAGAAGARLPGALGGRVCDRGDRHPRRLRRVPRRRRDAAARGDAALAAFRRHLAAAVGAPRPDLLRQVRHGGRHPRPARRRPGRRSC